jgi:hypothetical protein
VQGREARVGHVERQNRCSQYAQRHLNQQRKRLLLLQGSRLLPRLALIVQKDAVQAD